uniref:Peroxisomal membrane protein MPV17 n=1 Tax=Pseudictyota dubia TaxID=2749911 RepID=A0A7R9W596_9STRA|eukprot:CAMPEP_0197461562 /NCGR_PEP_ID=MMETSP1175-20131217/56867_1 /TAXON_ID=1003142 /ORGANISM="Triceratium dubium, Strain CCMP147" /LENGTH=262 /DNA_ID=CAMNT_0042996865 /DNA_START=63 /DNA_END=851 /DNA_ORIENTATION=+
MKSFLLLSVQLLGATLSTEALVSSSSRQALHRGALPRTPAFGAAGTSPATIASANGRHGSQIKMVDAGFADSVTGAWAAYNDALEANPLVTKSITAGVILGSADFAGQAIERATKEDSEGSVDLARAARFAVFGLVLQAPWNHFYYLLLDGVLPPTVEPWTTTTGVKVVIDQFVQAPIFTVLIFIFLGLLEGKTTDAIKSQLDEDYKDTMLANWKLWVPATVVNIAFCPPILRVLFLNVVFFFWSIFLSLKLNKNEEPSQQA